MERRIVRRHRFFHFWFICIQFFFVSSVQAGDLHYYLDYAVFNANQGFKFVELYFGIYQNSLEYAPVNDKYKTNIKLAVEVLSNDSLVSAQSWENASEIESLAVLQQGQLLHDIYGIYLKEGRYRILTRLTDLNLKQVSEKAFDIEINSPKNKQLTTSDIQLAGNISREEGNSSFIKNGYRILPNPRCIYSHTNPVLYYYLELYNLSDLTHSMDSSYTVNINITDQSGAVVQQAPPKSKLRAGKSVLEIGQIYLSELTAGFYKLQIGVIDPAIQDTAHVEKSFYFFSENPVVRQNSGQRRASISLAEMAEDSLDLYFRYASYIASRGDRDTYQELGVEAKRNFLQEFWAMRDNDPATIFNEFMEDYYSRVLFTNEAYSNAFNKGWKTDRGRIFILHGQPDDIRRHAGTLAGQRSYEIWQYYRVEGGVEFIFSDESGYGDFKLVHSTATNEIHDVRWESRL